MLLLSDPRGTCRCGQKNDWLCICHYLGFCGGELDPRSPPFLFCCCFVVVVVIELLYSILLVFLLLVFLLERRHLTRTLEEEEEGKNLITFGNKKEANDSVATGILPQYGDPRGG